MTFRLFGLHDETLRLKSFSSSTSGTKGTIRIVIETSDLRIRLDLAGAGRGSGGAAPEIETRTQAETGETEVAGIACAPARAAGSRYGGMIMFVNVGINIKGDSPCFGSTEAEAKAVVAEYLRVLADQIEHHDEAAASGDIQDTDSEEIIGRLSFKFVS